MLKVTIDRPVILQPDTHRLLP